MSRLFRPVLVLTWLAASVVCGAAQPEETSSALPPLPVLSETTLAGFEPLAREQIREAFEDVQLRPRDAASNGRLGMVLHAYQLDSEALVCYERAKLLDRQPFPWVYYLATIQADQRKDPGAVVRLYEEALRRKPDYLPIRLKLVELLLDIHGLERASQITEGLLREHPNSARAQYLAGRVKSAMGNVAAAAENYRIACELSPRFGPAHYALGLAYRKLGDTAKAVEHLKLYQENQASVPPAEDPFLEEIENLKSGAYHYINEGKRLYDKGRIAEAFENYKKAAEMNPQLVHAHVNLISIYGTQGDFTQAEKHYRTAIELNPDLAEVHYNYGLVLTQQKRYTEAEEAFQKAILSNPYFADAYNNLGSVLEARGQFDKAEHNFRQAIENKPQHREAYFGLGRIATRSGKSDEAIEYYLRTLTPEDEKTPVFMYSLAYAYAGARDFEKARQYGQRARDLAISYGQSKMVKTLERFLEKVKQADPAH